MRFSLNLLWIFSRYCCQILENIKIIGPYTEEIWIPKHWTFNITTGRQFCPKTFGGRCMCDQLIACTSVGVLRRRRRRRRQRRRRNQKQNTTEILIFRGYYNPVCYSLYFLQMFTNILACLPLPTKLDGGYVFTSVCCMLACAVCLSVWLSVCLSLCSHSSVHTYALIAIKFIQHIQACYHTALDKFGENRTNVKVTTFVKIT